MQGSHFSCDTKFHVFSILLSGENNEIQGQFGFKSGFFVDNVNQNYFCKWHLEKWSLKQNVQSSSFSRFWVKIPGFYYFLSKFQHFPGLEKKMTQFQVCNMFKVFQVGWKPWYIQQVRGL